MLLRELAPFDRAAFCRVHEVSREHFAPWFPAASPEEHFARELAKVEAGRERGTHLRLVGATEDGRLAAFFSLNEIVRGVFQSAYASWAVSAEFIRLGMGSEGVRALLDLAFSAERGLALHRVQANIIPDNVASLRLAERVGFRREGLAERYLQIAGRWQDHVMFAKTVEEHGFTYL
jgi:[ribosomal protein S5]-alanine N-acetyltransferase